MIDEVNATIADILNNLEFNYPATITAKPIINLTLREYLMEHEKEIIEQIREEWNIPEDAKLYFDYDKLCLIYVPNITAEYYDIDFFIGDVNASCDNMEITAIPTVRMKTSVIDGAEEDTND